MSSSKKSNYEKTRDEWYKKLKESGFDDLEYKDGSIRSGIPRSAAAKDGIKIEAIRDYYYMSYHFLNDHTFDTEVEKVIWEYHTNGISVRDIAKLLKDAGVKGHARDKVWGIIRRLETIMKLKYLTP